MFWGCHDSAPPFGRQAWPDGGAFLAQYQLVVDVLTAMRGIFNRYARQR